jgi:hypothetical protein
MNFDYQDLKFWLEDKDVLPQAYWDALEDYDPDNLNSDQVLSNWLGYDHVNDFYAYEMDITYHEEQADVDGYIMTPPTLPHLFTTHLLRLIWGCTTTTLIGQQP